MSTKLKPSAAPAGAPTSEQPTGAVTEIVAAGHFGLLLPSRRERRQYRPKSFRVFWGAVLDNAEWLRRLSPSAEIILTRAEYKASLQEAFLAGQGLSIAEAQRKIGGGK